MGYCFDVIFYHEQQHLHSSALHWCHVLHQISKISTLIFHCSVSSHHCIITQHLTNSHHPLFSCCFRWSRIIACLPYLQSLLEKRWEIGAGGRGRIVTACTRSSKIFGVTLHHVFFNRHIILSSTSHTGTEFLKLHLHTEAWLPEAIFSTCIV